MYEINGGRYLAAKQVEDEKIILQKKRERGEYLQ